MMSFSLSIGVMVFNTAKLKVNRDVFGILSKIGESKGIFVVYSDEIQKYCVYKCPAF